MRGETKVTTWQTEDRKEKHTRAVKTEINKRRKEQNKKKIREMTTKKKEQKAKRRDKQQQKRQSVEGGVK